MTQAFTCGVCSHPIGRDAPHMRIYNTVVCLTCTGTRAAHNITACPVNWHDGWDHTTHVTDRDTARVLLTNGGHS